jgi:hypothetical protein
MSLAPASADEIVTQQAEAPRSAQGRDAYRALSLRRKLILAGFAAVLLACLIVDLMLGPARYSVSEVINALISPSTAPAAVRVVIWDIRLPVALMAVVTGAALAIAGAQMQTVLNNPGQPVHARHLGGRELRGSAGAGLRRRHRAARHRLCRAAQRLRHGDGRLAADPSAQPAPKPA